MSKNTDQVMGHGHEADGIEEYDNPMPDWWLGLFFVTIIWAVVYAVDWHFISETSQLQLYEAELAAAKAQWPQLDQVLDADMSDEALALGKETFESTCASCHKADLTGGIGPNLIDSEWIHGGEFASISKTITEGVAAKGMPAWGPILGPKKVAAAASYILSKGTGEPPAEPADVAVAADADAAAEPMEPADVAGTDDDGPVDPMVLGEQVFATNCVPCHKVDMTGSIGPNLVDDEWIHGGELADIQRTIVQGVPAKGMITWKGVLPDAEIEAVAQYVYAKSHPE